MITVQELIDKNLILIEQQVKPLLKTEVTEFSKFLITDLVTFLNNVLVKLKSLNEDLLHNIFKKIILVKIKKEVLLFEKSLINNSNFKNFQSEIILLYLEYQLLNEDLNHSWTFLCEKFNLKKNEQESIRLIEEKLSEISNLSGFEMAIDMITQSYPESFERRVERLRKVEQGLIKILKENYRDEFKIYFLSSIGRDNLNFLFNLFSSHYFEDSQRISTSVKYIMRSIFVSKETDNLSQNKINLLFSEAISLALKSKIHITFHNKFDYLFKIFKFNKLLNISFDNLHKILVLLNEINKIIKDDLFSAFLEFELDEIIQVNHLFIKSDKEYQISLISLLETLSKEKSIHKQRLVIRNFLNEKNFDNRDEFITTNSLKISDAKNFVDNCSNLEEYSKNIFNGNSKMYILIKHEDIILGHLKLEGIKSFLSYVDIQNSKGDIILLKGVAYGIDKNFEKVFLERNLELIPGKIFVIKLSNTKITPLRLISLYSINLIQPYINSLDSALFHEIEYYPKNWQRIFFQLFKGKRTNNRV